METLTLEALLLPWWKPIAYLFAIVLVLVTVRIGINFDVNKWMENRQQAKLNKEVAKRSKNCGHAWTLYHTSPFSRCNYCLAWIPTTTLLTALEFFDRKPLILGQTDSMLVTPMKGEVVVSDFIGKRPD